mmetsp:Transcript_11136/g.33375  ORF Transcript_11136/g.33375 Transcript_11136/m.33375 type:complete len:249 (+) Transcript_11136:2914-3660(+)
MPTGHDAPWRGNRTTRTSWQKYLPPNCAPMPRRCVNWRILDSHSRSRKARPCSLPDLGRPSKYLVEASLTVFRVISADRPPITSARWYGGHAAVPRDLILSSTNSKSDLSFSKALVCWYKNVLFAEPPPFAMNWKWYSLPCAAYRSICAGKFVFVFASSNMDVGATWEYRRLRRLYVSYTPSASRASSSPSVRTRPPRLPITMPVPVSWQPGRTMDAATFAFFKSSVATNRSFSEASSSSRIFASCFK